jgi:hypothetical protein
MLDEPLLGRSASTHLSFQTSLRVDAVSLPLMFWRTTNE